MGRLLLVVVALLPNALYAQSPPVRHLQPANARLAEEFTNLTWLRELRDGRVLLTDRQDNRLVVADYQTGQVRQIGRTGRGPGEHVQLDGMFPVGDDSSLIADFGRRRWLMLYRDSIVATLPPDLPAIMAVPVVPLGADRNANVIAHSYERHTVGDSLDLVLVDFRTGRARTVATLRSGVPMSALSRGSAKAGPGGSISYGRPLYDVRQEMPLLFPDGTLAIARYEPYHVDWRTPDGRWIHGAPLPLPHVRIDDRERKAFIARHPPAAGRTDWPEHVPPFDMRPLLASPEGWAVIPRVPSADFPDSRYDLVDRRGALVAMLQLAPDEKLLGFGAHSAYVVRTDDDGIERLERHPWP